MASASEREHLLPYLGIGMTGKLAVQIERKSFFGYVFENVRRAYYSATR